MRVGFLLRPAKRPRVLTPALRAACAARGIELVALEPGDSGPADWARLEALVHKAPDTPGLDERLAQFEAAAGASCVLLDPPAAVARLRDREAMLAPLAGAPLVLQPPAAGQQPQGLQPQPQHAVTISTPRQVTLPAGTSVAAAAAQCDAAGLSFPLLVKPLLSIPGDSAGAGTESGSGSTSSGSGGTDGHTLGVALSRDAALQQLVAGDVPGLGLPCVLQEFVPHGEALYKLYVIGPHVLLTRRNTLTRRSLEAAAAAAEATQRGVVLLPRQSAAVLPPPAALQQAAQAAQAQQPAQQQQAQAQPAALADASVAGDPRAPPLWAMQRLAAHLRQALGLSLFNVDLVNPRGAAGEAGAACAACVVLDINYFPGFDKVTGAEGLFADFLAACLARRRAA